MVFGRKGDVKALSTSFWKGAVHFTWIWMLVWVFVALTVFNNSQAGESVDYLRGAGDFELGLVGMEVQRVPRFARSTGGQTVLAKISDAGASGKSSRMLYLPELRKGGYRITFSALELVPGEDYRFEAEVGSGGQKDLTVEVYGNGRKLVHRKLVGTQGRQEYVSASFRLPKASNTAGDVYILYLWAYSKSDIYLDSLKLVGSPIASGVAEPIDIWLEPTRYLGVYAMGEPAHMKLRQRWSEGNKSKLSYKVIDPIQGVVHAEHTVDVFARDHAVREAELPIPTILRGYYIVEVYDLSRPEPKLLTSRAYAVIDPDPGPGDRRFFGLAIEEHGYRSKIDAFLSPYDPYLLANQIGAGSVRLFSTAMPDMLSKNGDKYDFSEADKVLALTEEYGLDPLVVLGSNQVQRIPAWMRSGQSDDAIDLLAGAAVGAHEREMEKSREQRYLSVVAYRDYLGKVFKQFKGRVSYYEIWNEPGHKFAVHDILKIAEITGRVRNTEDPEARLLGYSSTTRADAGKGRDPGAQPSFLRKVASLGGLTKIDILSYHSGHALYFMGKEFNKSDLQTDFEDRLRSILSKHRGDLPIWDTERGVPWESPHEERIDLRKGRVIDTESNPTRPSMVVAQQLPVIHAVAKSKNVGRIFWFGLDGSVPTIVRPKRKWLFFDMPIEPMAHLPVYDAMTQLLGDKEYQWRKSSEDGGRAYAFGGRGAQVILTYNWKGKNSYINIPQARNGTLDVLDIMGNRRTSTSVIDGNGCFRVSAWPQYLVFSGEPSSMDQVGLDSVGMQCEVF